MTHEVLISYSSLDKLQADAICNRLEAQGIRCWIAPRDVPVGTEYADSIVQAIEAAKVLLLVFSSNADQSKQVKREVERAVSAGIHIMPVRIEDAEMSKSMEYYVGSIHWLDAITPPLESHIDKLAQDLQALLRGGASPVQDQGNSAQTKARPAAAEAASTAPAHDSGRSATGARAPEKSARPVGMVAAAIVAAIAVGGYLLLSSPGDERGAAGASDVAAAVESAAETAQRATAAPAYANYETLVDECENNPAWQWSCEVPAIADPDAFLGGDCACTGRILLHIETGLYRCEALPASCGNVSFLATLGYEPEMEWYEDVTPR